jgi:hypothetical protein
MLDADMSELPEDLQRELFDSFQLQVRYDQAAHRVTLRVTISGDTLHRLVDTANAIIDLTADQRPLPRAETSLATEVTSSGGLSHALCALDCTVLKPQQRR